MKKEYNHEEKRSAGKEFKNFLIDLGFNDLIDEKSPMDFEISVGYSTLLSFFKNYVSINPNVVHNGDDSFVFSLNLPLVDYVVTCSVIPITSKKCEIKFDRVKTL